MPRPLYSKERAPATNRIGGWLGPRAVLDAVMKRKIPLPLRTEIFVFLNSKSDIYFSFLICTKKIRLSPRSCLISRNKLVSCVQAPSWKPPLVGYPLLIIQYIHRYPPNHSAVTTIRIPWTCHAVVIGPT
jgi:hypothetical protein